MILSLRYSNSAGKNSNYRVRPLGQGGGAGGIGGFAVTIRMRDENSHGGPEGLVTWFCRYDKNEG